MAAKTFSRRRWTEGSTSWPGRCRMWPDCQVRHWSAWWRSAGRARGKTSRLQRHRHRQQRTARWPRVWTMSSETSIKKADAEDQGFQAGHFFVLLSLLAATVAVVMARPSAPEHLILISLTIGAAGIAALFFYKMLAPLVAPHADLDRQPLSDRLRGELEREKALTLRSIKELEFDRAMGKVSPQDFDIMVARLRSRALGIMRQLEAGSSAYREVIEKELAQRIGTSRRPDQQVSRKATNRPDLQVGRTPAATSPRSCGCGTPNDPD